jgi:hypothetical protein
MDGLFQSEYIVEIAGKLLKRLIVESRLESRAILKSFAINSTTGGKVRPLEMITQGISVLKTS